MNYRYRFSADQTSPRGIFMEPVDIASAVARAMACARELEPQSIGDFELVESDETDSVLFDIEVLTTPNALDRCLAEQSLIANLVRAS